jgi:hypothetical protein
MLTDKQTRLKQYQESNTGTIRPLKRSKVLQHIKGRREVSAGKFIKEMSFIKRNGVNWYKFKVHEPR